MHQQPAGATEWRGEQDGSAGSVVGADAAVGPSAGSPPHRGSLKQLAIRGAVWSILGFGGAQVLRLASNLILTRLLFPEAFGLMALVNVVLLGLYFLSDIGLSASVVQHRGADNPDFLGTAWTMQVARGLGIWLISGLVAAPVARFYGEPQLNWLVPAAGMASAITCFSSTSLLRFQRQMAVGKLTRIQLATQVIGLTAMVLLAWAFRSVWALIYGSWATAATQVILSHVFNPGPPDRFRFDRQAFRVIARTGRWVFFSTCLTFLANQADRLMFGKLISLEALACYNLAYMISEVPRSLIQKITASVIFPAASRIADQPRDRLRAVILKYRRPYLLGMAACVILLTGFGDRLMLLLYDRRYQLGATLLPILAVGLWPRVLNQVMSGALMAVGQFHYNTIGSVLRLLLISVGVPLAFRLDGLRGAVCVVAAADFPYYLVDSYGRWRHRLGGFSQDLVATLFVAFGLAATIGVRGLTGLAWGR